MPAADVDGVELNVAIARWNGLAPRKPFWRHNFAGANVQLSRFAATDPAWIGTRAATVEAGRVTVLFALRSDFVSNCATYPQLNTLVNQQFIQVGAMEPDELVSAIARPALQVGLKIDPELIAQIMNDMQGEPGALPLMQFALRDLFDAEQAKGGPIALRLDDYLARGGLRLLRGRPAVRRAPGGQARVRPCASCLRRPHPRQRLPP